MSAPTRHNLMLDMTIVPPSDYFFTAPGGHTETKNLIYKSSSGNLSRLDTGNVETSGDYTGHPYLTVSWSGHYTNQETSSPSRIYYSGYLDANGGSTCVDFYWIVSGSYGGGGGNYFNDQICLWRYPPSAGNRGWYLDFWLIIEPNVHVRQHDIFHLDTDNPRGTYTHDAFHTNGSGYTSNISNVVVS